MDHRYFETRANTSRARRRGGMGLAFAILLAALFGLYIMKTGARATYAAQGTAPELIGQPQDWVNTNGKALNLYGPDGLITTHHVVLVDFWEYTCVNCLRTLPYLESWDKKYRKDGLVIVGIHTPEFQFAHSPQNVRDAVKRLGIAYPVLIDSDYKNWNAYRNNVWPHDFLLDGAGNVIEDYSGEGGYQETEEKIRAALKRIHPGLTFGPLTAAVRDSDKPGAVCYPETPELYCGYQEAAAHGEQLANPGGYRPGKTANYIDPNPVQHADGAVTTSGLWLATPQSLRHVGARLSDYIAIRYHALDANAVIKPESGTAFDVYVTQDGQPVAKKDAGADIHYDTQGRSYLHIDAPRMYQITHNAQFGAHELKLQTTSEDFGLYSFAFTSCTV